MANDNSTYFEFARNSTFTKDFNELACCNYPTSANGLAVDSYSHLYFGVLGSFIEKISTSGSNIGEVTPRNAPTAFAIASTTNDFYDADSGGTEILHFRPSCALSTEECAAADSFGTGDLSSGASGLAVDSLSNVVYAAVPGAGEVQAFGEEVIPDATTGPAENLQSTSATVSGQVNPDGRQITECEFEFGETESYGEVKPCAESPAEIGGGAQQVAVHADLSGLSSTPERTYHYRLVASNANGVRVFGLDHQFSDAAAPTIDGLSSANLSATTADLRAQINSHGADTTYQFEYGSSVAYGSSAPATEADAGSIDGDQSVEVELNGLQPGVTYHFRVIARNALGSATSQDQTFNFFPPNCPNITLRQQTRTSYLPDCRAYELVSPGNANGVLLTEPEDLRNSPLADNTFVYGGIAGVIPGTNPVNDLASDAYAATRTNSGWVTSYIGIPGNETSTDETRATDLSMDRFLVFNAEPPSAGLFSANISNAPYVYDSKGNRLARWPGNLDSIPGATEFAGQVSPSPDFSHLAFSSSNIAFTNEGLTTAPGSAYDFNTLSNTTSLISLTASGENILQGESIGFPGHASWYPGVSTNGSHILMSAGGVLYMRVNDALSYDVSRGHAVGYVDMTPDGSKVYFTSAEQLTPDDHDTSVDLYMWSEATDSLTRISGGNNGNGNSDACNASWISGCDVLPVVGGGRSDRALAANGDIYFYSPEQLDGSKGTSGQVNLYDYRDGQAQFVAALAPGTGCEHHPFEEDCGNGPLTRINVSPDDGHAAFLTSDPLTSYNNTATNGICSEELISGAPLSGPRCQEMYTYEPATGKIECASCNQSGAPPVSDAVGSEDGRFMTDDGRVFFYTLDALVPRDTNQKHDVYEYVDGRPQLITTGTGSQDASVVKFAADSSSATAREAGFSGVTADGEDVYFSTYNTLIGQDENGNFLKFYDARTDGGFPFVPPPAPCQAADECHGPGSPRWLCRGSRVVRTLATPAISGAIERQGTTGATAAGSGAAGGACTGSGEGRSMRAVTRGAGSECLGSRVPRWGRHAVPLFAASLAAGIVGLLLIGAAAKANSPIESFTAEPSSTQAGGHPDVIVESTHGTHTQPPNECGCSQPKNIITNLPPGLTGDPHATPQCDLVEFASDECPVDSQVGLIAFGIGLEPVYNLEPAGGEPGLIGFTTPVVHFPVFEIISPRTESDYGLKFSVLGIGLHHFVPLRELHQLLWGVPADPIHDTMRFPFGAVVCFGNAAAKVQIRFTELASHECGFPNYTGVVPSSSPEQPFIDNPTSCGTPLSAALEVDSYDGGTDQAETPYPATTGCDQLSFNPSLFAQPTTTQTDSASGLAVDLQVPQTVGPSVPSPSEIHSATVTLPPGFSINPNAADGKTSCTEAEAKFGTEEAAQCPDFSKVGSLSLSTSVLPGPLPGYVYLGQPLPAERYRIFLVADGFGVHVKLAGTVTPDPQTGQLVLAFESLPQTPFSDFNLHIFGSERGLLATPTQCGTYPVKSTFTPWDTALPDQTSTQFFTLDSGPGGTACPAANRPFDPGFSAGVIDNTAGAHSPFVLDLTREDGDQNLSALNVSTPPGFSATLAGIPYCSDAALSSAASDSYTGLEEQGNPSCPAASQIGTASAGAGAGTHPVDFPGKVYLAGPYKGAPLSLAVITPAVSGPYDLGNIVVRAALHINPITAQITAVSDPLPQILQGIPVRLRSILIYLDRKNFALNPTNCSHFSVSAEIFGDQGGLARPQQGFQVANCASLPFAPKLKLTVTGGSKRRANPSLLAVLTAKPGEANIASTEVTLPQSEFLDNAHLQNPCTRAQYAANACPPSTVIGFAKAETPLLEKPLEGPVYLRASSHKLPDIVAALGGQIPIELDSRVDSIHQRLRTDFEAAPDAPISRFSLTLNGGSRGLLINSENLCRSASLAEVKITGQNGAQAGENVALQTPCEGAAKKRRHRRASGGLG